MIRMLLTTLLALTWMTCVAAAQPNDCHRPRPGQGGAIIQPSRMDQVLFSTLVGAEVSFQRCLAGLSPLVENPELRDVAISHAGWQATHQVLSHISGRPGYRTLVDRFKRGGVEFQRAAENLARVSRFKLDQHGRFRVNSDQVCSFSTREGRPIPEHSYSSLARYVVDLWMKSPGHAKNLLDPRVSEHGAAFAFDARAPHCGNFYITQNFRLPPAHR